MFALLLGRRADVYYGARSASFSERTKWPVDKWPVDILHPKCHSHDRRWYSRYTISYELSTSANVGTGNETGMGDSVWLPHFLFFYRGCGLYVCNACRLNRM